MRRRVLAIVPVFLVLVSLVVSAFSGELPCVKPEEVGVSSQALDRLDAYIQKMVDNKQLPGVVVMMARHGKVVHRKPIGLIDLDPMTARRISHVAVWVFHGAKDPAVPLERSEKMVEALKKANGNVKFTIYPEAGHDSWTQAYNDQELYTWLLQQKRVPRKPESKKK